MLRDKLLARLAEMGDAPDHQRLTEEVLGIRGAPPALAQKLVAQALVQEDRREVWRRAGERICPSAPRTPGVYVLKDADGRALYVGKALNLRRRLRAHFAEHRWRAITPALSRAADAEWREVGSELEALLREAASIEELQPPVNIQRFAPALDTRAIPRALLRDVLVVLPSVEEDSVELVGARLDGAWMIQRTRRNGADLGVHSRRIMTFFRTPSAKPLAPSPLSPIVFSWLAGRGETATRINARDLQSARDLALRLGALFRDDRLFHERIEQC
jgi:predicted GIY-YIG superfamily endonuclease